MTESLRAVVADDSVLLRDGVVRLLEDDGIEVVAAVGDGEQLVAAEPKLLSQRQATAGQRDTVHPQCDGIVRRSWRFVVVEALWISQSDIAAKAGRAISRFDAQVLERSPVVEQYRN